MSTISVQPVKDVAASVAYLLFGNDADRRERLQANGQTRAAAIAVSTATGSTSPAEFVARVQRLAKTTGRKNEAYSYVLAFAPDEFDVTSQADLARVRDIALRLVTQMHSADFLVVVHADAIGNHAHAHICVRNFDNTTGRSLQRFTSWRHGLHQLNDLVMREEGLRVLPNPMLPKPSWEERRASFAADGFEQTLGDAVSDALRDPRTVDQNSFEAILGKRGITLAITNRDGWSYKMKRSDNGKLGRRKASSLTPDFTADAVSKIFQQRAAGIPHHALPVPAPGLILEPAEFEAIASRLRRSMAARTHTTPARERFLRERQPQRHREYGD